MQSASSRSEDAAWPQPGWSVPSAPGWRAEALQLLGAASPEGVVSSATPGVMAAEGPEGPHKGRVGVVDGPRSPQSQTPGAVWHSASTGSRHLGWLCSLGLGLFPAAVSWP